MFGLDYTTAPIATVVKMNAVFVCRYVGYFQGYNLNEIMIPQGKCLSLVEANALKASGIDIVSAYEWYANRASLANAGSSIASFNAGVWDAHVSIAIHEGCGGPPNAPIYFAVDYQTNGTDTVEYFKGIASVIGYGRTGVYGSYDCVKYLLDNHLVSYAWQTYAWSVGQWDPRVNIRQYNNGVDVDGTQVDLNESMTADYGSWSERGTPVFSNEMCVAIWNSTGMGSDDSARTSGLFNKWRLLWKDDHNFLGAPTTHEYPFPLLGGGHSVARNFGSNTLVWNNGDPFILKG